MRDMTVIVYEDDYEPEVRPFLETNWAANDKSLIGRRSSHYSIRSISRVVLSLYHKDLIDEFERQEAMLWLTT